MSSEDEKKEVETNDSAHDDSKIDILQSTVPLEDMSSSNDTGTKRKRSDLNIPITSTTNLPTWVAGKDFEIVFLTKLVFNVDIFSFSRKKGILNYSNISLVLSDCGTRNFKFSFIAKPKFVL